MDAPTLADLDWPRRTPRLALRPALESDVEAVRAYRALDEVERWLGGRQGDLASFREWFARPTRLATTLVVEQDGQVVGDLMVKPGDGWAQVDVADRAAGTQAELGWVLDPAHGGRGLATEALQALLAVCFDDLGLRRVTAGCFAANGASWRLMERVGMRREAHTVRDSLHRELGWVDGLSYALLAEEWRGRPSA